MRAFPFCYILIKCPVRLLYSEDGGRRVLSFRWESLPLPGAPWGWDKMKVMKNEEEGRHGFQQMSLEDFFKQTGKSLEHTLLTHSGGVGLF